MTDEDFYISEINHYTNCLFDGLRRLNSAKTEDKDYWKNFIEYCKEYIYYYAENLAKLKGEK